MLQRPFKQLRPGGPISAREENRAKEGLTKALGGIGGIGGGIDWGATAGFAGEESLGMWLQITAGGNSPLAWQEMVPTPYVPLRTGGGAPAEVEVWSPGEGAGSNAYEVLGRQVPAGYTAWARYDVGTDRWVFDGPDSIWIQITGGAQPYSWQQVVPAVSANVLTWPNGALSGTLTAYEANDNALVPAGTIVRAWLDAATGTLEFAYSASASDLATKKVRLYTARLPSYTFNSANGTLTYTATGVTANIDGRAPILHDRMLFNPGNAPEAGLYFLTTIGAVGIATVWTRTADANLSVLLPGGSLVEITDGTYYSGTFWELSTLDPITLNVTNLLFLKFGMTIDDTMLTNAIPRVIANNRFVPSSITDDLTTLTMTRRVATPPNPTPIVIATTANNFAVGDYVIIYLSGSGSAQTITGITNGTDGRWLRLVNIGIYPITLAALNGGSVAANQFQSPYTIEPGDFVDLFYRGMTGRWEPPLQKPLAIGATSILETDPRCEAGILNIYNRTRNLSLDAAGLISTVTDWVFAHAAGCCVCGSGSGSGSGSGGPCCYPVTPPSTVCLSPATLPGVNMASCCSDVLKPQLCTYTGTVGNYCIYQSARFTVCGLSCYWYYEVSSTLSIAELIFADGTYAVWEGGGCVWPWTMRFEAANNVLCDYAHLSVVASSGACPGHVLACCDSSKYSYPNTLYAKVTSTGATCYDANLSGTVYTLQWVDSFLVNGEYKAGWVSLIPLPFTGPYTGCDVDLFAIMFLQSDTCKLWFGCVELTSPDQFGAPTGTCNPLDLVFTVTADTKGCCPPYSNQPYVGFTATVEITQTAPAGNVPTGNNCAPSTSPVCCANMTLPPTLCLTVPSFVKPCDVIGGLFTCYRVNTGVYYSPLFWAPFANDYLYWEIICGNPGNNVQVHLISYSTDQYGYGKIWLTFGFMGAGANCAFPITALYTPTSTQLPCTPNSAASVQIDLPVAGVCLPAPPAPTCTTGLCSHCSVPIVKKPCFTIAGVGNAILNCAVLNATWTLDDNSIDCQWKTSQYFFFGNLTYAYYWKLTFNGSTWTLVIWNFTLGQAEATWTVADTGCSFPKTMTLVTTGVNTWIESLYCKNIPRSITLFCDPASCGGGVGPLCTGGPGCSQCTSPVPAALLLGVQGIINGTCADCASALNGTFTLCNSGDCLWTSDPFDSCVGMTSSPGEKVQWRFFTGLYNNKSVSALQLILAGHTNTGIIAQWENDASKCTFPVTMPLVSGYGFYTTGPCNAASFPSSLTVSPA